MKISGTKTFPAWATYLLPPFSLLFAIAVLEILVRILHLGPLPPTYAGKTYSKANGGRLDCMNPSVARPYYYQADNPYPGCVFYSIDKFLWRNARTIKTTKPAKTKRLVAIGDSLTYGFGVRERDTFLVKLEQHWKSQGKPIEVINAAQVAAALPEYEKILDRALPLQHDLILFGIHLNDIISFPTSLIIEKTAKSFDWRLRNHLRLLEFILHRFERKSSAQENVRSMLESYTPQRKKDFVNFLAQVREKTASLRVPVAFVIYPIFYDFENYAFTEIHQDLRAALATAGFPHLDLLPYFSGTNAANFWITKNDQHPNELANQIFFEQIQSFLDPQLK